MTRTLSGKMKCDKCQLPKHGRNDHGIGFPYREDQIIF